MHNTQSTALLFDLSKPGRRCHRLPAPDVPARPAKELVPADQLADNPPPLPEVAESDLIRHFTNLSQRNFSIDTNFYPLGSCTMKYNPKRHERVAAYPAFAGLHPLQDEESTQGMLEVLWEMQTFLAEISGLPAVSLQPAAGAQGELTALYVAAANRRASSCMTARAPWTLDSGWYGWMAAKPGCRATSSLTFGLYFIVHDPSG